MLSTWVIATRPWSFTAAIIPIALGSALAWSGTMRITGVSFHLFNFLLILICGVLLQAGTNLLNTYGDFTSGVDTVESATTCPQIVKGILLPNRVKRVGIGLLFIAAILGSILLLLSGWPILFFGVLGLIAAPTYTVGCCPYKYKGYGPLVVFLLMGPCIVLPAYYVQSELLTWSAFFASIPISFLVTAIIHANDLRDIEYDTRANIRTVAMWLGLSKSLQLYKRLCLGAMLSLILVVICGFVPVTALLPLVLVPYVNAKLKKLCNTAKDELTSLEGWTAQYHLLFGILYLGGVLLWRIVVLLM